MKVILFGATGMVGQGVLRECLLDPKVQSVLSIGRRKTGQTGAKFRELIPPDLSDLSAHESELSGFDACFFCLGVSSVGLAEADYRRVTYDLTLAIAQTLARLNPAMTFIYVSGEGTDGSERGRMMWARVKGQTENALLRLPFKAAVMFRPGFIVPLHGIVSKTLLYRIPYALLRPFGPMLYRMLPRYVTTTEQLGRAMLRIAESGSSKTVLTNRDMNAL
jgi:uncharacterized protein YbjT (DUF2867 family)